jgi:hypothetical protein
MLEELRRRNYAESTIHTYIHTVEHFSRNFHGSPDQLGPDHIRRAVHAWEAGSSLGGASDTALRLPVTSPVSAKPFLDSSPVYRLSTQRWFVVQYLSELMAISAELGEVLTQ